MIEILDESRMSIKFFRREFGDINVVSLLYVSLFSSILTNEASLHDLVIRLSQ